MTAGPGPDSAPSSGSDRQPAVVLEHRYRLGRQVGQGGRAVVFAARDLLLDRDVAVKVFRARAVEAGELRLQEAEARVLASLNHYALTTLFDAGVTHDPEGLPQLYLVMELVVGTTLQERVAAAALSALEFALLGFDLMEGLASVHAAGYLHRDIKPANVLIPAKTGLRAMPGKLADFGIATLIGEPDLSEFTTGTAAYLSPEQVEGMDASAASDVYSLGLVLVETWKREVEFPGGIEQSAYARLERDPHVPDDVPRELATVLRGMVAYRPEERLDLHRAARGFYEFLTEEIGRTRMVAARSRAGDDARESERVEVLGEYGLATTGPDEAFDRFARRAALLANAPMGAICLFGPDGTWFKASHGRQPSRIDPRALLIPRAGPGTWHVDDASAVLTSLPRRPGEMHVAAVRSGAGAMIVTHDGYLLGSVCVFDTEPRRWEARHLDLLTDLVVSVLTEMELRRAMHHALFADR